VLYKNLAPHSSTVRGRKPARCDSRSGSWGGQVDRIIDIDQGPIGRTPRSNPRDVYGASFDEVRKLFAAMSEAKIRGYKRGDASASKRKRRALRRMSRPGRQNKSKCIFFG